MKLKYRGLDLSSFIAALDTVTKAQNVTTLQGFFSQSTKTFPDQVLMMRVNPYTEGLKQESQAGDPFSPVSKHKTLQFRN